MRDTCAGGGAYARCTSARGRPQESSVAPRIIRSLKPARSVAGNSPPETGGARRRRGAGADVGRRCDGRGAEYVWASGSKSPDLVDRRFCRRSPDAMAPLKTGAGPAGPGGGVRRDFVDCAAGVPRPSRWPRRSGRRMAHAAQGGLSFWSPRPLLSL